MTSYVDSSALVAVYVSEHFSKPARRALRAVPQVPFTQFHELEVRNAFELLAGRAIMSRQECRSMHAQLHDDIENQRLVRFSLDLDRVSSDAHELSRLHASRRARHSSPPMIVN